MTPFTKSQTEQLIANCQAQIVRMDNAEPDIDFKPVVNLFTPDAQCTWLLTELGLDDIAFGLRDLSIGSPELGFVSMHTRAHRHLTTLRAPRRRGARFSRLRVPIEHYLQSKKTAYPANWGIPPTQWLRICPTPSREPLPYPV
jgi:Protein of unknown function (DUF2958)